MRIRSGLLCLCIMWSLQASQRNPFMMPHSGCEATLKQLDDWRLQGVMTLSSHSTALMTHPRQAPLRVKVGSELMAEVKVTAVSIDSISVSLGTICDGGYYHWHLPGRKNDKENHRRAIAASALRRQGESPRHSDAGRGSGSASLTNTGRTAAT